MRIGLEDETGLPDWIQHFRYSFRRIYPHFIDVRGPPDLQHD